MTTSSRHSPTASVVPAQPRRIGSASLPALGAEGVTRVPSSGEETG